MNKTKIGITGSRGMKIEDIPKDFLDWVKRNREKMILVHGGAPGVDTVISDFVKELGIPTETIRPSFRQGATTRELKFSYLQRNEVIVDSTEATFAFWDGHSKGTKYTMDYAKKHNKLRHTFILSPAKNVPLTNQIPTEEFLSVPSSTTKKF